MQEKKRTSTVREANFQAHDSSLRLLHEATVINYTDGDMVVILTPRVNDTFVLWPYSYASCLPDIEKRPSTVGGSSSSLLYVWNSILLQKRAGRKTTMNMLSSLPSRAPAVLSLSTPPSDIAESELCDPASVTAIDDRVAMEVSLRMSNKFNYDNTKMFLTAGHVIEAEHTFLDVEALHAVS